MRVKSPCSKHLKAFGEFLEGEGVQLQVPYTEEEFQAWMGGKTPEQAQELGMADPLMKMVAIIGLHVGHAWPLVWTALDVTPDSPSCPFCITEFMKKNPDCKDPDCEACQDPAPFLMKAALTEWRENNASN